MTGAHAMHPPLAGLLTGLEPYVVRGRVGACEGLLVTAHGLAELVAMGDLCALERCPGTTEPGLATDARMLAEVVALDGDEVRLMPYDQVRGVKLAAPVSIVRGQGRIYPTPDWLGRVVDALGRPIDDGPALPCGDIPYPLDGTPTPAHLRRPLGPRLELGVRALDLFVPCCHGQRLGIFAGSGVGKSTLIAMLARQTRADAIVLGLIGERGREVRLFLDEVLGAEGRARTVTVVATSDQPPMLRKRAAQLTLTLAEALRDSGLSVLCLFDSVTRYAMALREIRLAAGEPPTSRGYPPGVFAELPRLLERAGPGQGAGTITGLFTVLVEADDVNDPIADAVRGLLDGHVVLDRGIAEGGRFPAIDVTRSLSRTAPGCYADAERVPIARARRLIKAHADVAELIQLGAYRPGGDPEIDEAIRVRPALEAVLAQEVDEPGRHEDGVSRLGTALGP